MNLYRNASMKKLIACDRALRPGRTAFAQEKELKVAIDPTYEPFTFKTPDGKPTGFDVDIANALCEQIKRKCVFVEQVWDSMIPGSAGQEVRRHHQLHVDHRRPPEGQLTSPTSTTTRPARSS
jgi:hypothetical protein